MRRKAILLLFITFFVAAAVCAQTKTPLTNADIIEMVRAGFGEEMIVKAVKANDTKFDVSVQGLLDLKAAGVPGPVIEAMLEAETKKRPFGLAAPGGPHSSSAGEGSGSAALAGLPDAPGIYANVKGTYVELMPELVNWRTGGILKSMATMGMSGGHINGTVKGRHSRLQLSQPIEILLRGPSDISVSEVQLLRLDEHKNRREFRTFTGGVLHASGGSDKNAVSFDYKTISPRVAYHVSLTSLKKGEYGFLVGNRLFTFSVLE